MDNAAIGILETKGLAIILEAADVMLKAANITLVGKERAGGGIYTLIIKGEISDVKEAISVCLEKIKSDQNSGIRQIEVRIITNPHKEMDKLL